MINKKTKTKTQVNPASVVETIENLNRQSKLYQRLFAFSLIANEAMADIDRLLDLILAEIIDEQKLAETCSVFLMNDDGKKIKLQRKKGIHQEFVQYTEFDLGQGVAGIVAQTGESILINDCSNDPRYLPYRNGVRQLRSILAVPMSFKGEILGVICIHNSTKKGGFTEGDQTCLMELAKIAAISVNNANLFNSAIYDSITDPATDLLNRRGTELAVQQNVKKAKQNKLPLSVLFIDADDLKHFNDAYNYNMGDQVILSVAASIKNNIYSRDFCGKWKEGDEFVVILPNCNIETAQVKAEKIRAAVEAKGLPTLPAERLSVSIGVATLSPGMKGYYSIVETAEQAKNQAKQEGKNRVCLFPNQKMKEE